jgi:diaminopimelate decarboxylase
MIPTPAFVVDEPLLALFAERFESALERHWPNSILSYSFKTNALPWLISYLRERGVWAEVVSDHEYELALALGYPPERIVYNGPVKGRERLRAALAAGSIVNLDAKREVEWAAELGRELPDAQLAVGLRVNWDLEARVPGESTTGAAGSRFGFNVDNGELDEAIARLRAGGVRLAGLHMHRNSRTQAVDVYRASATLAAELIAERGLELDWVDIGGGFFGSVDGSPTFDDYVGAIRECLAGAVDPARTRLIVEPGGSLTAVPIEFHASVVDVKWVGDSRFVVTDTSRTDLDPLFRRRRPFAVDLTTTSTATVPSQIVSGFTCMEDDRLLTLEDAPELRVGDRLVFRNVGAYTMSYQSTFIELPPAVYVRDAAGAYTQVRERASVADYLRGNTWLPSRTLSGHFL